MDQNALYRMLYMRREYTALMDHLQELQGLIFMPSECTGCGGEDKWQGLIFIRAEKSPWHRGAFAFTVTFPPKYPFECPVAEFDLPLESHPLLQQGGRRIPFEAEYINCDPMRVSVMMRLLKYIRRLFVPQEWRRTVTDEHGEMREVGGSVVDARRSQKDVELRSVAQEVILSKPYVEFLTTEGKDWVLHQYALQRTTDRHADRGDDAGDKGLEVTERGSFAQWFTRSFLPAIGVTQ